VQHSVLPHLPLASALVLRSFGKTYGLAGLRLGFAAGTAPDCDQIRSALGPWPVAGPAIAIAQRAFADTAWLDRTAERLRHGANRLDRLLQSAGFDIIGGTSLFRLARHDAAASWFTQLCRNGILTRPFHAQPDWLRLGLPGTQEDWTRLEAAVRP
jgi:cobalamin biosynthetic protein CobC